MTVAAASFLLALVCVTLAVDHDFNQRYPACFLDHLEYCKDIQGLANTFQCLDQKLDLLSPACKKSLESSPAFQCSSDALSLCSRVDDHYDLMSCIWAHRAGALSSRCIESGLHQNGHEGQSHLKHHEGHHECHCGHDRHHGKHCGHHDREGHHKHDMDHDDLEHHGHSERHHRRHGHRHHHDREHGRYLRACKYDVRRFCYGAEGLVNKMACLAEHEDELSESCNMVMKHCPAFHCAHDVQKFCPGVKSKHEFIECLWEHRHELSDECMNQGGDDSDDHMRSKDKCRHEREKFCPEEQRSSPKHDLKCLGKRDQNGISEMCRQSLHMRQSCQDEVKKFCNSDDSYPLKCLQHHQDELSQDCKAALPHGSQQTAAMTSSLVSCPSHFLRREIIATVTVLSTFFLVILFVGRCMRLKREEGRYEYQRI